MQSMTSDDIAGIPEAEGTISYPQRAESLFREADDRLARRMRWQNQLDTTLRELTTALDQHAFVSGEMAGATVAAFEADANLAYAELDFRAKLIAQEGGIAGRNADERKINLDLAVMDDEDLSALREVADRKRHARTTVEANLRLWDVRQKALRAQITGYTALLSY